ncbi:Bacteriophage CII protein [Serratia entomophila]|uniref:lambda phage CII family protein n=1 Tax=Serratia entomophila TaxID=42906 RepID=UPI00217AC317|nr:lambda phage CII family protein [Serratia entomophila]CAI1925999.1 Bacteriophage CII protein [Serratia entomophila]
MGNTTYSKKALRIESQLLGKLAALGQHRFATLMGIDEPKVSRMKQGFFQQMSMALAILEYGIDDNEIVELARRFAAVLTNKKPLGATKGSEQQITINF